MPFKLQPGEMQQKWLNYKAACDSHVKSERYQGQIILVPKPKIYMLDSFCVFAGIEHGELEKYERNKNYRALVRQIKYAVPARKLDALVNGEGSAAGLIFDLSVNYGLQPATADKKQRNEYDAASKHRGITLDTDGQRAKKEQAGGVAATVNHPRASGPGATGTPVNCAEMAAECPPGCVESPSKVEESPPFSSQPGSEMLELHPDFPDLGAENGQNAPGAEENVLISTVGPPEPVTVSLTCYGALMLNNRRLWGIKNLKRRVRAP